MGRVNSPLARPPSKPEAALAPSGHAVRPAPVAIRYLIAFAVAMSATALRTLLDPALGLHEPFSLHLVATFVVASLFGGGPALVCAGLGFLLGDWYFVAPRGSFLLGGTPSQTAAGLYVMESLVLVSVGHLIGRRASPRVEAPTEAPTEAPAALPETDTDLARLSADLRSAEAALRRSGENWRALLENSVDPIVVMGAQGIIEEFNPAAERLFDIPRSEALGRPLADIAIPPEQRALHLADLAQYLAGAAPVNRIEVSSQRSDGTPLAMELTVRRMQGDGPPRFIVYIRDLTERREAEAVIRAQGARLGATLDVLVDSVVYVDRSGLVRFANSASVHLLGDPLIGVTPGAWTARLPVDFLGVPGTLDSLHGALASGQIVRNRRVEFIDASGAPRVVLASIVPVVDDDAIQGAVLSMHDLTQELLLANELESANIELRTRFEELLAQQEVLAARSEEVTKQRAQLAHSNADLVSASRLKSEFLATMSHELRTPLNAVIGFAEVLLADKARPLGEAHRPFVAEIRTAGEQLLLLINDVLDLTRIEAGRLQIRTERMDLAGPVLQARELTSVLAKQRNVAVVNNISPGHLSVIADPDRVRQVVLNLLSNALKFTPSGGTVTLKAVEFPMGFARISVSDTGIGIDSNDLHKLFQPFTQLESGLARRRGGSGLGLSISKQLAEAMNGTIGCESVFGRGSTFYFTLPLANAAGLATVDVAEDTFVPSDTRGVPQIFLRDADAEHTPWESAPSRSLAPADAPAAAAASVLPAPATPGTVVHPGRLHVLIVDDNAVNRRVLRSMLAPTSCELTEAPDGSTAIQLARDLRPGVILMDLQMPEMDGLEATRILTADRATAGIPVVAITAHAMLGDADRALEAGCVGYLAKPVGRENLMNAIDRAVGSSAWRS